MFNTTIVEPEVFILIIGKEVLVKSPTSAVFFKDNLKSVWKRRDTNVLEPLT